MGLFSVQLHPEHGPAGAARTPDPLPTRLRLAVRAALRNTRNELAVAWRDIKLAMIAATNDAWIVAIMLLLAAIALGLEMAVSFHLL